MEMRKRTTCGRHLAKHPDRYWIFVVDVENILYTFFKDIKMLMDSWTNQMGFPIVTVLEHRVEGRKRVLKLRQSRFISDGSDDETNSLWIVPISLISSANPDLPKQVLFTKREQEFVFEDIGENEWIKVSENGRICLKSFYYFWNVLVECRNFGLLSRQIHTRIVSFNFGGSQHERTFGFGSFWNCEWLLCVGSGRQTNRRRVFGIFQKVCQRRGIHCVDGGRQRTCRYLPLHWL